MRNASVQELKKIDSRLVAAVCKLLPYNATGMSDKYVDISENTGQKKVMLKKQLHLKKC